MSETLYDKPRGRKSTEARKNDELIGRTEEAVTERCARIKNTKRTTQFVDWSPMGFTSWLLEETWKRRHEPWTVIARISPFRTLQTQASIFVCLPAYSILAAVSEVGVARSIGWNTAKEIGVSSIPVFACLRWLYVNVNGVGMFFDSRSVQGSQKDLSAACALGNRFEVWKSLPECIAVGMAAAT